MPAKPPKIRPELDHFARLVARGMDQAKAYREASGKSSATDKSAWEIASRWAIKARARIEELREGARVAAKREYVYEYEHAMAEIDEAVQMAREQGDPSAMTRALALKAKISGLEVEGRKNERRPFAEMDDAALAGFVREQVEALGITLQ